jgi:tRNA G18 (ribose-2'-O)-methylase SpoU
MTRREQERNQRGYFGIGIENGKSSANLGTLWRSAFAYDAALLFTIGERYHPQASDTTKTWRHVPFVNYETFDQFFAAMPYDCPLIGVELDHAARPLDGFTHPPRALYLLGAEDHGLSKAALAKCHSLVVLPGRYCLNVAVAGSIVMHHRYTQRESTELRQVS